MNRNDFESRGREVRTASAELRAESDEMALVGYATLFNNLSSNLGGFRETIKPGAFSRSLNSGARPVCLFNHDANKILGRAPGTLTVSVNPANLAAGTYTSNLQIAAAGLIGGAAAAEGPGRERVERTPNRRLHFVQIDVFASRRLQGNQLAVFTDGRGLSDAEMQNIAREVNFQETTFVLPRPAAIERE